MLDRIQELDTGQKSFKEDAVRLCGMVLGLRRITPTGVYFSDRFAHSDTRVTGINISVFAVFG